MKDAELWFGDCLDLMDGIPDKSVDMIFTDLPFGTTNCKWDSPINLDDLWKQYKRIRKKGCAILLYAQTPFDKVLGVSNLKELRYEWIWEKTTATGHLNSKKMPMKCHENILVFYDSLPVYNPQMSHGNKRKVSLARHKENTPSSGKSGIYHEHMKFSDYDSTDRYPRDVIQFKSDKQKLSLHPTQKPESLTEYMIRTYTNQGDLVLDSTMGSGTTGTVSVRLGRRFIGIDNDEHYFNIAVNRINKIIQPPLPHSPAATLEQDKKESK